MNVQPNFLARRRKPRFKLPPGTTDAHCHVFGPGAVFPYAPNRKYTPEDAPKEMLRVLHDYLGIERSDDLVMIQLTVSNTRARAQKQRLYRRIVERLTASPGLRPEDILINLVEVLPENWSFGHGEAQYVR